MAQSLGFPESGPGAVFMNRSELFYRLALTLFSAPLAEEAVFRWGIYGLFKKEAFAGFAGPYIGPGFWALP